MRLLDRLFRRDWVRTRPQAPLELPPDAVEVLEAQVRAAQKLLDVRITIDERTLRVLRQYGGNLRVDDAHEPAPPRRRSED